MQRILALLLVVVLALAAACGSDDGAPPTPPSTPLPTSTAEAVGGAVILPNEPAEGFELGDPSFEALPGAEAFFGRLGGTVYQIEMPDDWNGRLVLWAHGFRGWDITLATEAPPVARQGLIAAGTAWASSSYSANGYVPYQGAHETAALYDYFVEQFGRPDYTYIAGASMGGAVAVLSLELFPTRYDGALAACSAMGLAEVDFVGHYLVLGAYAASVTQEEYDSMESMDELVDRIVTTLDGDAEARDLFEGLVTVLTGGPRPFRHEGFEEFYLQNFQLAAQAGSDSEGVFDNIDFVYPVDPNGDVTADELNRDVVRIAGDPQVRNVAPNFTDRTGAVPVPLLTIHTTGDGWVPISLEDEFRRIVEAAGNGDMLVQRAVRASGHCDFSAQEIAAAAADLFNWVEDGIKPAGEEISPPLEDAGLDFTQPLRDGDPGGL